MNAAASSEGIMFVMLKLRVIAFRLGLESTEMLATEKVACVTNQVGNELPSMRKAK